MSRALDALQTRSSNPAQRESIWWHRPCFPIGMVQSVHTKAKGKAIPHQSAAAERLGRQLAALTPWKTRRMSWPIFQKHWPPSCAEVAAAATGAICVAAPVPPGTSTDRMRVPSRSRDLGGDRPQGLAVPRSVGPQPPAEVTHAGPPKRLRVAPPGPPRSRDTVTPDHNPGALSAA